MTLLALFALQSPVVLVVEGHRPASEAVVGKAAMKYLPFDVPKGATSLEVAPEILDREGDRDTVDLGLFDPNGTGEKGFRGWQGGTRRPSTLTGSFATTSPWAIAGPLPAGRWHLAQYYLKASSKGLDYRYRITIRFDGPKPPGHVPPVPGIPDPGGLPRWYVGDLHAHSLSSDGALTLRELVERHKKAGFDFMASTEHNTPAAHWALAETMRAIPGITLIPGTELTTPGGHTNLIGLRPDRWIDFRTEPGDGLLPRRYADARRQGAVISVNHPFADCTSCAWTFPPEEWKAAHGIEVWNGPWDLTDEKALALWDSLLRAGRRINAYGGSDFHRDPNLLSPAVKVWSDSRRPSDLVKGLREGRVVVRQGSAGPDLGLAVFGAGSSAMPGGELKGKGPVEVRIEANDAAGAILSVHSRRGAEGAPLVVEGDRFRQTIAVPREGFVRLELRAKDGRMLALTNAVRLP